MPAAASIAVVDDDLSVRRALHRLLTSTGFDVRIFASGEALLASGFGGVASCLLIDVHLQGMNGFELYGQLREHGYEPAVVFMTGHHSDETRELARAIPRAAYLRKPFDDEALLDAVEGVTTPPQGYGAPPAGGGLNRPGGGA